MTTAGSSHAVIAAAVNLNHRGHYLHWGVLQVSAANLTVIAIMLVLFALALLLPFPTKRKRGGRS